VLVGEIASSSFYVYGTILVLVEQVHLFGVQTTPLEMARMTNC